MENSEGLLFVIGEIKEELLELESMLENRKSTLEVDFEEIQQLESQIKKSIKRLKILEELKKGLEGHKEERENFGKNIIPDQTIRLVSNQELRKVQDKGIFEEKMVRSEQEGKEFHIAQIKKYNSDTDGHRVVKLSPIIVSDSENKYSKSHQKEFIIKEEKVGILPKSEVWRDQREVGRPFIGEWEIPNDEEKEEKMKNKEFRKLKHLESENNKLQIEDSGEEVSSIRRRRKSSIVHGEKVLGIRRGVLEDETLGESIGSRVSVFSKMGNKEKIDLDLEGNIPRRLPHFRGKDGIDDPQEFLEIFTRICRASGIRVGRYPAILAICLDNVDACWFESWLDNHLTNKTTWKEVSVAFISHFQNPNMNAQWLAQIRALRMDHSGVQDILINF